MGYQIDIETETLFVPYSEFETRIYRSNIVGRYINELLTAGYGIQSIIE